jgi:hypothetical protein
MARAEVDVSHAAISRALASLGERAGGAEVADALDCGWEGFEAQMRRRMRCRARGHRGAYLCLARAGAEKVRFHLEATGAIPATVPRRRGPGVTIRVGDRGRRSRRRRARPPHPRGRGGEGRCR